MSRHALIASAGRDAKTIEALVKECREQIAELAQLIDCVEQRTQVEQVRTLTRELRTARDTWNLRAEKAWQVAAQFKFDEAVAADLRGEATELRTGAEQVVSAAGQVATSAQSLSQGRPSRPHRSKRRRRRWNR